MQPDDSDVGFLTGALVILFALWMLNAERRRLSGIESKALLAFGAIVLVLVLFPFFFLFGLAVIGGAMWVSPVFHRVFGFDLRALIKAYVLVDGSGMFFVWTTLVGVLPSLVFLCFDAIRKRWRGREPTEQGGSGRSRP